MLKDPSFIWRKSEPLLERCALLQGNLTQKWPQGEQRVRTSSVHLGVAWRLAKTPVDVVLGALVLRRTEHCVGWSVLDDDTWSSLLSEEERAQV